MHDSLRVLIVSNMIPSPEVPQYGVFVARQARALEQNGCTVEIVGLEKQSTGRAGTVRKYRGLGSRGVHAADRMQPDVILAHYLVPTALMARRAARGAPRGRQDSMCHPKNAGRSGGIPRGAARPNGARERVS